MARPSARGLDVLAKPFTATAVAGAYARKDRLVVNVKDHGARGDNVTDDTLAIMDAYDTLVARGGGDLKFPAGYYLCNTQTGSANGLAWILSIVDDNVRLVGEGRGATRIRTTSTTARLLFIAGAGKPEGPTNWLKYVPWRYAGDTFTSGSAITPASPFVVRPIATASRGAMSVTCTTPADASHFSAGDFVAIRTGQLTTDTGNWNAEPDSEYNKVISADAGTGIVVLERPLAKPYVQEYQSAIGVPSSTTVAAVTCPLGIVNITQAVIEDIGILDLTLEASAVGALPPFTLRGVVSGGVFDFAYDTSAIPCDAMEYRDVHWWIDALMTGSARADYWPITTAVGCSDVYIHRCHAISTQKMATLHLHEGSSRIHVDGNGLSLFSGGGTAGNYSVSIRSRAYDIHITPGWKIAGAGVSNAIFIGSTESGGGRIGKGSVRGPSWTRSIGCQSQNWEIEPPDDGKGGDIQWEPQVRAPLTTQPVKTLMGWVSDDNQTVYLGQLPAQHFVINVYIDVQEAFDSDGTDRISVGRTGDTASYATPTDVDTTGRKTPTLAFQARYLGVTEDLTAYYANGGTEPTVGKALVIVEYVLAPTIVA